MYRSALTFCLCFWLISVPVWAETAHVAVAANFRPAMDTLEAVFEIETGHDLQVSYGATGQFFSQIQHGAPYDVFLAADGERPHLLAEIQANGAEARTYAIGQLALWSPLTEALGADALRGSGLRFLAVANAQLAPYGAAAEAVIAALGLGEALEGKLVRGSNVAQAFVFVQTGNAELGFVALSQILSLPEGKRGTYWLPPPELYPTIRQDAVLLDHGQDNAAAIAFFRFLFSDQARSIIENAGYELP